MISGQRAAIAAAVFAIEWTGCAEFHDAQRNALGHINVNDPPQSLESRQPEQPRDPGVRVVRLNAGVLAGGGGTLSTRSTGAYGVGGEISLHVGSRDRTPGLPLLDRALGLNLGINVLDSSVKGPGPAYAEAQFTWRELWLAGGWAFDGSRAQGRQATAGFGPFFVRYRHLFEGEGSIILGVLVKGGITWTTSR